MGKFLAETHPHLRSEFLYTIGNDGKKDESKSFNVLRPYSKFYVMWKCCKINCEKKCEHIYKALISNRTNRKSGCPFCAGQKVCVCNSFASKQPELSKEWGNNGILQPSDISEKSTRDIQWKCLKSDCNHVHIWITSPYSRVAQKYGCPFCSGRKVCLCNSFAAKQPELTKEWGENGELKPIDIAEKCCKKIFWKCLLSKCEHHVWGSSPNDRVSSKTGCPFCNGKQFCECYCLASEFPNLLNEEWDEKKNDEEGLDIFKLGPRSERYAWWICKVCFYSWKTRISVRTSLQSGCPKCSASKMEKAMADILKKIEIEKYA